MAIIYTVLIFGLIIFIHELGHFIAARASKVTVNEFSIGMGPALFKKKVKKTLYSLRILPIGGYVAMEGENDDSEDENAFIKKSVIKRIIICAAGATMNLILGFLLIGSTFIGVDRIGTTTISGFRDDSVSNQYGLMSGDKILKINNSTIFTDRDIVFEIFRDDNGVMPILVLRDNEKVLLEKVTFKVDELDAEKSLYIDFSVKGEDLTIMGGLKSAALETVSIARNSIISVVDLISGKIPFTELSGPIGVGQVVGQVAKTNFKNLINIAAFISISIGMFNLLPFPALDGGRILLLLIEAVRRKRIPVKYEGYINMAGLLMLFTLMIVITFKDIFFLFK